MEWRQTTETAGEPEARKQIGAWVQQQLPQGVQGTLTEVYALDGKNAAVSAVVALAGQLGTITGRRLFLPALLFVTAPEDHFSPEEARMAAVDLHYAGESTDHVVMHLPQGWSVESEPKPADFRMACARIAYDAMEPTYRSGGDQAQTGTRIRATGGERVCCALRFLQQGGCNGQAGSGFDAA